jgi:hypothetical protein
MPFVLLACACAPAPRGVLASPEPTPRADSPPGVATPSSEPLAAPIAPAPPAYDLEADRRHIAEQAAHELGPSTTITIAQEVFVLVGAPGWDARALAQSRALTTQAIDAYYNHRFDKRPEHAIAVYLFPTAAPYQAYCQARLRRACLSRYGSYHPDEHVIVMNAGLGLGTLTHELVHPIVEVDFPRAPTWLNEGIASLFEAPAIVRPGEITGVKNWRHPRLLAALSAPEDKSEARLDALFGMSDAHFRGEQEDLHYAVARYVCQWLDQRGLLFAFYRAWRDGVEQDPTGEKAFAAVTGQSPAEAHAAWAKWVRAL